MSATSIEHSRRAVYAAASRVFQDRLSQQQVMEFWESKFSRETVFHVSDFAAKLRTHVGLTDVQRRELMVSIFSALSKPESQLAPVPTVLQVGHAQPANDMGSVASQEEPLVVPAKSQKDPANVVFSTLVTKFISGVAAKQRNARGELQDAFIDSLGDTRVDPRVSQRFAKWAQEGFEDEKVPELSNTGKMPDVLNILYVALCDVAGPVATDKALNNAVAAADELPESQEFSASSLL